MNSGNSGYSSLNKSPNMSISETSNLKTSITNAPIINTPIINIPIINTPIINTPITKTIPIPQKPKAKTTKLDSVSNYLKDNTKRKLFETDDFD